jgi:hypothetical protein
LPGTDPPIRIAAGATGILALGIESPWYP